ncbi:MAG: fatty acyl-AMP ligase, partial [Proteobacteria bacterium]|nr:fatty acyl-AMP ligase [Pseudomonadota bacterium]
MNSFRSMNDLLRHRAETQPDDPAYAFVNERGEEESRLTFAELDRLARALAEPIRLHTRPGDRARLIFPQGLDFIAAWFGCLYAGVIPVPVVSPKRNRLRHSTRAIVEDCRPALALTTSALLGEVRGEFAGSPAWDAMGWMAADRRDVPTDNAPPHDARPGDVAFLQYTSGSTSQPKGVMVGHGNLIANLEMIQRALGNTRKSTYVSWVPLYHDMGLILNVLQTLYVGSLCVLMAPNGFMQRPLNWLRAISDYRAEVAGAPSFAFDLCTTRHRADAMEGVDLSCWRLAFNGAEPVRADTLRTFAETFAPHGLDARALYPCYGMAEGTLLLSGGRRDAPPVIRAVSRAALQAGQAIPAIADARDVVGCGRELSGERLAIVDPQTGMECAPGGVGEIWAAGPHIAQGYWNNPAATRETFQARLAGGGEGPFLRSGDLGFMLDGELFIAGRLKDVIIVRGQNHYPQDIEATAAACHPALRPNHAAAFTVGEAGAEKLVIVQEVERVWRNRADYVELEGLVRAAVVAEHELMA